ncbi:MAG: extracellular solute-binding protein [Ruminococcaceae bacterium]|nr:extracellular solute-binding protein [Oscillospiraceae bacterium]
MKKALSLILALMLLFTFVACSNNQQGSDDPTKAPSDATPTETADPVDDRFVDYPGAGGFDEYRLPKYETTVKEITIMAGFDHTPAPGKDNHLLDVYGIQIKTDIVTWDQQTAKFISAYMANESPDVCNFGLPVAMINKGYFQPWEAIIDFDLGLWQGLKSSLENSWFNGHIYSVNYTNARWDNVCWYNKDLFEEYGVKTPTEYYEEDNWTWDTFRDCARAMHTDSDGDGIPEIYGCKIDNYMFIASTGLDYITLNNDGTISNNILDANIARGITYYVSMIDEGIVYDGNDDGDAFARGQVALMSAHCWVRTFFPEMLANGQVGIVPYPKDPQADKYYLAEGFNAFLCPTNAKDPMASAAYVCTTRYDKLVATYDEEKIAETEAMTIQEQIESIGWPYEMEKWVFDELYKDKFTPVANVSEAFEIMINFSGDIWFRPLMGEPWSAISEELAPKIDSHIEDIMDI